MKCNFQKAKDEGAFIIASFHMGRMHSLELQQYQIEIAHAAIDDGAEMVFAHHPHTCLGIEIYKGKPIYYSIGHFVFCDNSLPGECLPCVRSEKLQAEPLAGRQYRINRQKP